jgi:hypothetical protein
MKRENKKPPPVFPPAEALYARYHSHLSLTDHKLTGTYKKSPYLRQKIGAIIAVPPYIILVVLFVT